MDALQALTLRHKGLSNRQIATQLAVSPSTVDQTFKKLSRLLDTPAKLQAYESERARMLTVVEHRYLTSLLDEEAIAKCSPLQRATIFGILFDKARLERGQSTQNVSLMAQIVGASDRSLFASKQVEHVDDTSKSCKQAVSPIKTVAIRCGINDTAQAGSDNVSCVNPLARVDVDPQPVVVAQGTPPTPCVGGTGGLEQAEGALVTHDLPVDEKVS